MTLRGRLTTAFLVVVLGPVLLGSFFVGMTAATVSRDRTGERLDHAVTTIRTAMGAMCRQLQAVADSVAVLPGPARQAAADQMVRRGLASAVQIGGVDRPDWRDCSVPAGGGVAAVAARSQAADTTVTVAQALDGGFVDRLAASSGAEVTLLADRPTATYSTAPAGARDAIAEVDGTPAGRGAATGWRVATATTVRTPVGDRLVRRLDPAPGQPLPLAVSVPVADPTPQYAVLLGAVLLVAGGAVFVARWLAQSTTRPLATLARAADRVANGDLEARVPVLRTDELGRLAGTFNRMTRELQTYVQALTASRDQLRGHLAILGDTLSSTHDLHRILQVILQTARSATGARAGVVLLVDATNETLVARVAEGLTGRWAVPEAELAALRVPLGVGILGAVAATGQPRRGPCDVAGESAGGPVADEPQCLTYLAVPISAPAVVGDPLAPGEPPATAAPATLGVLALYDRLGTEQFDDTDLLTLRTFAGQAGVAVHNVRLHEEAQRLSLTDPLTGLWNYRHLRESLRREVERANRFGRMLTVLVLDLDHFKEVNDTYGHAAGDAVLGEFARRLRTALREVDVAFRQGGEEFVVVLPETDAFGGAIVAERLGAAVRDVPVPIDTRRHEVDRIPVTVSIGIAVYPEHGRTADQVLDAADDALYAAKNAGRDTYRLADLVTASQPDEPVPPMIDRPALPEAQPRDAGQPSPRNGRETGAVSGPAPRGHFDEAAAAPGGPPPRPARGR